MACKDTAGRARTACLNWETQQRNQCAQWRTEWTRRCDQWETEQQRRCTQWHTEQQRRCDRWEEERHRECDSWFILFRWICTAWVWITTTVCRVWAWITVTICDVWTWISTTVCRLWVWVGTVVCAVWTIVTTLICRFWAMIIDLWCLISCTLRRWAAPDEFSESKSECIYGWTSAYRADFEAKECVLRITLRIRLAPLAGVDAAALAAAQAQWETAIENRWTGALPLIMTGGNCRCERVRVVLDAQFVASGEHHVVQVHPGNGRADMANWFVTDDGGTAAHEAGHMLGNPDEYADANCPGRTVTADNSIMQMTAGQVRDRHYESFARWLSNRTCCDYVPRG